MRIDYLLLCTILPFFIATWCSKESYRKLSVNPLVMISIRSLRFFIMSRFVYWVAFGILTTAFILAILLLGSGGEQTRTMIANSIKVGDGTANFFLSTMGKYFLPIIFVTLFTALASLAIIGRTALKLFPIDEPPGEQFSRFRFTFFILACSLIAPPLLFGSLLLL